MPNDTPSLADRLVAAERERDRWRNLYEQKVRLLALWRDVFNAALAHTPPEGAS